MGISKVEPERYETLLAEKAARLEQAFALHSPPPLEVYASPRSHYRMRCEFRTWHQGDDLDYVMFEPGDKYRHHKLTSCPMVHRPIEELMFPLLEVIREDRELRYRLFQVDFLSTLGTGEREGEPGGEPGGMLVTLLYHRPLGDPWRAKAEALAERFGVHIMGRARKQRLVLSQDYLVETLTVHGRPYHTKQVESSFTQPNAVICQSMLEWAVDATRGIGGDLVEFYCGNGNFTFPLAANFRRVIATEISKTSARAAAAGVELNGLSNVDLVRISAEDFTRVLRGELTTRRMKGIDLREYDFRAVVVDPPRAGLDDDTVRQVQLYEHILYVSCNPSTLLDNLATLTETHEITRFALFDQFPYTDHIETGVLLRRR